MKTRNTLMRRFIKHMRKTYRNKIFSVGMILFGILAVWVTDGDGNALVWALLFGVPMFFAKEDIWEKYGDY